VDHAKPHCRPWPDRACWGEGPPPGPASLPTASSLTSTCFPGIWAGPGAGLEFPVSSEAAGSLAWSHPGRFPNATLKPAAAVPASATRRVSYSVVRGSLPEIPRTGPRSCNLEGTDEGRGRGGRACLLFFVGGFARRAFPPCPSTTEPWPRGPHRGAGPCARSFSPAPNCAPDTIKGGFPRRSPRTLTGPRKLEDAPSKPAILPRAGPAGRGAVRKSRGTAAAFDPSAARTAGFRPAFAPRGPGRRNRGLEEASRGSTLENAVRESNIHRATWRCRRPGRRTPLPPTDLRARARRGGPLFPAGGGRPGPGRRPSKLAEYYRKAAQ